MDFKRVMDFNKKVTNEVSKVIIGKNDVIELVTTSIICGGHVLIEDVPGLGKTMLIKAFSKALGLDFKRIQFTPDLMPSDLTGINFYNQKILEFEFKEGPLFSSIVLADEINRATPRTQSSLLEAMEEGQITVDGVTRKLREPFMVLATQNPVESYGTFPLPEAQLDRFFMRISMGYPKHDEEKEIILKFKGLNPLNDLKCVVDKDELNFVKEACREVEISNEVLNYLMEIIESTRNHEKIHLGVSPRGSIALFKASQVKAALEGRDYIIPEDIKFMAPYILNHRIIYRGALKTASPTEFIREITSSIKVPMED